ncbi:restriction endonuclease subunit S [Spirosoma flavus]
MSEYYQIGKIANVKGGKRLPKGHDFVETKNIPYLRVVDMVNGGIDDSDIKYISSQTEKLIKNYKITVEDIYVTIAGTIGNFGVIPQKFDNAQLTENAAKLSGIDASNFSINYLVYKFSSKEIQAQIWQEIGIGGGVPKLALHRIQKIRFKAPSLPNQRKIARILSTIDGQIEKTEAIIAKYQAIKQGMLQDLFTRGIDVRTGQLRPRYKDAPELYKESSLGMIPKEWEVTTTGKVSRSIVPGRSKSQSFSGGTPWITTPDFESDYVSKSRENLGLNDKEIKTSGNKKVPANSVIMTCVGELGVSAINSCEVVLNQQLHAFVPNDDLLPEYLLYSLRYEKSQMLRIVGFNVVPYMNKSVCESIEIRLSKIDEQVEMMKRMMSATNTILSSQHFLSKLQSLKQGLMQDLLSGKIEVSA